MIHRGPGLPAAMRAEWQQSEHQQFVQKHYQKRGLRAVDSSTGYKQCPPRQLTGIEIIYGPDNGPSAA